MITAERTLRAEFVASRVLYLRFDSSRGVCLVSNLCGGVMSLAASTPGVLRILAVVVAWSRRSTPVDSDARGDLT